MATPEEIAAWRRKYGIGTTPPVAPPVAQAVPPIAAPVTPPTSIPFGPDPQTLQNIGGGIQSAATAATSFLSSLLGKIPGIPGIPGVSTAWGVIPQVDIPGVSRVGGVLPQVDVPYVTPAIETGVDYAMRPLDIMGETTTGIVGLEKALAEQLGISGRVIDPLNISSDVFTRPETAQMGAGELAGTLLEDFRSRPWYQQLGLGIATDPTGILPIGTLGTALRTGRAPAEAAWRTSAQALRATDRARDVARTRWPAPAGPAPAAVPDRPMLALPPGQGQPVGALPPGRPPVDPSIIPEVSRPVAAPAQRALGPGVREITGEHPRPMPGDVAQQRAGAVSDPRVENYAPRFPGQRVAQGVEQPAVFYRSTGTAGQSRVVSYNPARPGAMILEDTVSTVPPGGAVETVGVKTGSNILQEGSREFQRLAGGTGGRRAGESVADFVKRVSNSAKNRGTYDIVRFTRQPGVNAVVLNEDALIRNYTAPRSEFELLSQMGVISARPRPGQPALMPPPGLRPGTAEVVGRPSPGEVVRERPGVQRIAVERDPTMPYEAAGRGEGFAREMLRGEVAAASDTGLPVWSVAPDGQVFQATRGPEAQAYRQPTVNFEVGPNGDAVMIPWGTQRPRPMSDAAKRAQVQQFEQRLMSGETQGTVPGASSFDEGINAAEAAEFIERLDSTPREATRARPEGTAFGDNVDLPPPRDPANALLDELDIPTHEPKKIAVMRKFDGARNAIGLELENFVLTGRQLLLRAAGRGVKIDREGMTPLFRALHGEVPKESLSPALRQMFDQIDEVRKLEDADMKAFIENARGTEFEDYMAFDLDQFQDRMIATPDYFPQLWKKDGVEIATGQIGARPGFTLPRAGSFSEMVAQGYTPMSWDPYKMMALRKLAGVNWRETVIFLGRAKRNDLAVPFAELEARGMSRTHRVPRGVGSAFEGRLVQTTDAGGIPQSIRTPQWALPNEMASFVETMWGRRPSAYIGDKEVIGYIRKFRNGFKSAKLFASFFQHMDISLRTSASLFTLHGLKRGGPLRLPSMAARLLQAQWSTGYRNEIRQRYLSTAPIKGHEDLGISYKMLVEEGLGVSGDITVIQREIADTLTDIERATNPVGKARQKIVDANKFFQSGLFDGVYREGISWSLESFIIPAIRKQHPTWTARQVAAEAASNANVMFSSLPQWQSVLKDPWVRELGQTLFFSTNETEGLLRSFFGTMVGPRKAFWLQYYGGMMLTLAFFGNLINMAANGKPLPPESYSPIDVGNPYSFTGVGYSTRFMSPQLPQWMGFSGREGSPLHLDIVGQMDTAFRVVSDPIGATAARVNVPVRAVVNQVRGTNFFGEELSVAQRPGQLLTDLYGPIGMTSALGAFTEGIPQLKTVLPEGEARMGVRGQLLEGIAGVGMRAERTGDYLTRISTGVYNEDTNYSDLERFQKLDVRRLPQVQTELGLRQETALKREGAEAKYYAALDNIDSERTTKLGNLVMDIRMGLESYQIKDRYYDIETYGRGRRKQAGVDKEFEAPDVNDSDPNKRALAQHYAIYDDPRVKRPGDDLDFAMRDKILKEMYLDPNSDKAWTEEQFKFVMRNTNTRPIPVEIFSQLGAKTQAKQLTSQMLREQFYRQMGRDDLADASRIRFYMLDAPFMMQPVTPSAPIGPPPPAPPPPPPARSNQEQINAWRQKYLVGAGR